MKIEQLYRLGRLVAEDPVPDWLYDEVNDAARNAAWATDWGKVMLDLLTTRMADEVRAATARALLGLDSGDMRNLLTRTEALISQDPDNEAAYWDAMWELRRGVSAEREYRANLEYYANWLEKQARHREYKWPVDWEPEYCAVWQDAGGSPATANAWARAGWDAQSALLAEIPARRGYMTIRQRVECLTPPPFVPTESRTCWHSYPASRVPNGGAA